MSKEDHTYRRTSASSHGGGHAEVCTAELTVRAQEAVSKQPQFRGRSKSFTFALHGDTLVVRGTVPTYYLKQLLQTALKDLKGIRRIDNQVVVTASSGVVGPGGGIDSVEPP